MVVNASASLATPMGIKSAAAARAEHISIEGEIDHATPVRTPHRKVRSKFSLASSMRKCTTELALLEDHYLQVQATRAGKEPLKYSIDLRFLNSQPLRVRRIAWAKFCLSALLALGAAGAVWLTSSAVSLFSQPYFIGACAAALVSIVVLIMGFRDTSESLNFTSVNGGATWVSVLGGIGSTKNGKAFFVAMIKDIAAAKAARPQSKQQWLRDEMREHHRLREAGALSEAEYEASKARILKAHS